MPFLLPAPVALILRADAPTRISLRHLSADQMILQLRFPNGANQPGSAPDISGLESLVADGNTLVVSGTGAATTEIGRLVQLLEVTPTRIRLRLRVVQIVGPDRVGV